VTLPFGLLVAWAGLSGIMAESPAWAMYGIIRAVEALLIFLYGANLLIATKEIDFFFKCLSFTIALTTLIALSQNFLGTSFNLQVLGGSELLLREQYGTENISRVSGFFGHANNLSYFLAGWLPVLLMGVLGRIRPVFNVYYLTTFALGCIALVMTYSRGGWTAFFFSLIIIVWLLFLRRFKLQNFNKLVIYTLGLFVLSSFIIVPFYSRIETRLIRDEYDASYARVSLAITALKIIKDNAIMGVGLKNYQIAVPKYDSNPPLHPSGDPYPVHNIYLEMAAELGIPGFLLLICVLSLFLKRGWSGTRGIDRQVILCSIGLFAGLCALYLHGIVDHGALGDSKFISLSFMGGLATALSHFSGGHNNKQPRLQKE
jgi:O-antigen ligase